MQLSTNLKTHAVITFTNVHYLINQSQYSFLSQAGKGEEITVDGNLLKTNNIADILTLEKYYETYPEKKPLSYQPLPDYERVVFSKEKLVRALSEIIRGFKKHFGDRKLPPQSQNILAHMEAKLELAKQTKDDKKYDNPIMELRTQFFND
jgi:hypothetical protein